MNNAETNDVNQGSRRPSHVAYSVKDRGDGKKAEWRPIGVAWTHADGKGINLVLDMMPFDGRITLRAAASDENKE